MKPKELAHELTKKQGLKPLLFCVIRVREIVLAALCLIASQSFAIPPNTDFTNTAQVLYTVSGSSHAASDSATLTTSPGAGNSPPYDISPSTFAVAENAIGVSLGAIVGHDLDPGDTVTWTLSDARFEVVAGELRLRPGASLDFELVPSLVITATVQDPTGANYQEDLAVSIANVNEAPSQIDLTNTQVVADQLGSIVGGLTVVDPDVGDIHTYTVDDTRFQIVTDQLKLLDGQSLPLGASVDVTVIATDTGGLQYAQLFTITAGPPGGGSSIAPSIRFLQSAQLSGGGQPFDVELSQCDAGSGLSPLGDPVTVFGNQAGLPGVHEFLPVGLWKSGGAGFFEITDVDANLDPLVRDQITVQLASDSDSEEVTVLEAGINTGIFVGFIPVQQNPGIAADCELQTNLNQVVSLSYSDALDPLRTAQGSVVVDSYGRVFSSLGGQPVNGAQIRILAGASGQPAAVFAEDGVTATSPVVLSGNTNEGFPTGAYRYPHVPAGTYVLEVTPPNRFTFPSAVADGVLQVLPGAPYALSPGSRGQSFILNVGPALRLDIPLDLLPVVPTQSEMELSVAIAGGSPQYVVQSQCFDGTGFVPSADPNTLQLGTITPPAQVGLANANRVNRGDAIFITLRDGDQDLDPFAPDTLEVEVSVVGQLDTERVRLLETNDSTGVFTGYLQTTVLTPTPYNCALEADANSDVQLAYVDPTDPQDSSSRNFLLDPGFVVFSSVDGSFLDGTSVTLIDNFTGLPADGAVFAADGTTSFPSTVVSGATAVDGAGQTYDFASGTVYFPVIDPGEYRIEVLPATSFVFPSARDDAELDNLATGPYQLTVGSRGDAFTVSAGVPSAFDIPLDPLNLDLFIAKEASKDVVGVGDFLQYRILVENTNTAGSVSGTTLQDRLPVGLRYAQDSLVINDQSVAPAISADGWGLSLPLGQIDPGQQIEIRYVTEVTVEAREGTLRNHAYLEGIGLSNANVAFADVRVRNDLFVDQAFIIGRVVEGDCRTEQENGRVPTGIGGVRVWLEDGTSVVTDESGKYHIDDVSPGTHVVQLDEASLPPGLELALCDPTSQHAGSLRSQFVDLPPGGLWRADFYATSGRAPISEVVTRLDAEAKAEEREIEYTYRLRTGIVPMETIRVTLQLDDVLGFVSGSATLDGSSMEDPRMFGNTLSFRLPDTTTSIEHVLRFRASLVEDANVIRSKAIVMLQSEGDTHRSEPLMNELGFNWPAALRTIADTTDVFRARPQIAEDENTEALMRARVSNAQRLDDDFGRTVDSASTDNDTDNENSGDPQEAHEQENSRASVAERQTVQKLEPRISGGVHEPSLGEHVSRSKVAKLVLNGSVPVEYERVLPYELPEQHRQDKIGDPASLLRESGVVGIAYPPEDYNPVMPAVPVAVIHPIELKPEILVDGALVSSLTFEGLFQDQTSGLAISHWDGVPISENDSLLDVRLLDREGETISRFERTIHFSGAPAKAELDRDKSYLVADGMTPPMLAIRLFDRAGQPLRAGTTGEFAVGAPYEVLNKTKHLENLSNEFNNRKYRVLDDGYAYIQLEPTVTTGEVELRFQFDQVRRETVRARLEPGARDWILVGLAETSISSNSLEGNDESLAAHGLADDILHDGRVAFYAKGMVRGDWLVTAAYDTDEEFTEELKRQIDPNQFYTLYGDGTAQLHDAQSQRKLYLKVEKARFAGLFGDFDTELQRSELTRYERRLNGARFDYHGSKVEVRSFVSEVGQSFVRDELRGDGTSGIYRLSRNGLVRFGEQVRIVTRDRFQLDEVLDATQLSRYQDYTIDYERGTLLFKQPIASQDHAFNPVVIEVEYEVGGGARGQDIVSGGRVAYRIDDNESELALTYIHDESAGENGKAGSMVGLDYTHQINPNNRLTVEVAQSKDGKPPTVTTAGTTKGDAYLVELEHASEKVGGRVYVQEIDDQFGLGQTSSFATGLKKYGVEGEFRPNGAMKLTAQAFVQESLSQNTTRDVLSTEVEVQRWRAQWVGGLRAVREESAIGESEANQLLLGVNRNFLKNKLTLRLDNELDFSSGTGNTDYPTRSMLGVEYKLFNDVSLIGEQELSWSDARDTQDTRVGLRARPWRGGDVRSMMHREQGENGERLFATTGLAQQWRLSDAWLVDAGLDRVATIAERGDLEATQASIFDASLDPTSGSFDEDFAAYFAGATYQQAAWNVSTRVERHDGDMAEKLNWLLGANRQLSEGRVVSSSISYLTEKLQDGGRNDGMDIQFALALRPEASPWAVFNRTDLSFDRRISESFDTRTRKWVNNTHVNYAANARHQVSMQFGLKYVVDEFDGQEYDGVTALYGGQYRFNFHPRWDLGVQAGLLHSLKSGVSQRTAGLSVGFSAFANSWISVGYNFVGFRDDDFVAADFTAKGPYLKLRLKFDQEVARKFLQHVGLRREGSLKVH